MVHGGETGFPRRTGTRCFLCVGLGCTVSSSHVWENLQIQAFHVA